MFVSPETKRKYSNTVQYIEGKRTGCDALHRKVKKIMETLMVNHSPYSFSHSFTHPLTHSITHLQAVAPSTAYPRVKVCTEYPHSCKFECRPIPANTIIMMGSQPPWSAILNSSGLLPLYTTVHM